MQHHIIKIYTIQLTSHSYFVIPLRDQTGGLCYDYEVSVLCWSPECEVTPNTGTTLVPGMMYTGTPSLVSTRKSQTAVSKYHIGCHIHGMSQLRDYSQLNFIKKKLQPSIVSYT